MAAGLTEKQKRFCEEYLIDLNGTRPYRVAYPSVKKEETAAANAARLLRNAKVRDFIQKLKQERESRVLVSQDDVIKAIQEIAFDVSEKAKDRLRALELLCRHLGMFDQKDDLDKEEQKARIAKLKRDAQSEEEKAEIAVSILGVDVEELGEIIG
jgi:phage terminase small subunit